MKIQDVAKLSTKDRFLYWIKERESIRLKKEAGKPKPWTDDPILQMYRFCNVRRMDDKVSQWLLRHWYEPHFDHPNMLMACSLARFINLPESLEELGFPTRWNPARIVKVLSARRDRGCNVFNAAYIVSTNGVTGNKIDIVVNSHLAPLFSLRTSVCKSATMWKAWNTLTGSKGVGSFMAGQIVADLRWAVSCEWSDRLTWAPMGPGSKRGLNRLLGRDKNTPIKQLEFEAELAKVIDLCRGVLSTICGRLEAIDHQNCLCEFDKYERTLHGEGRPKRNYDGGGS